MLHITDGESVAGTLRQSAVSGQVSVYGDLMNEGPAPAGLDGEQWREARAPFLASAFDLDLDDARQYLKQCDDALAAFTHHEEVVLWFDHRLSNQLMLVRALDWLSTQDRSAVRISLVPVPTEPDFLGLGALEASSLAALSEARVLVTEAQYRTAQAAWKAFTSPDPTDIERFLSTDTSALPFIASALRRHLEQYPALNDGLSRTERQALAVLTERGSLSGPKLFVAVQREEEAVFMGDVSFYRLVAAVAGPSHPLVTIADSVENELGAVSLTTTGKAVLEGRADHVELNGIDVWLGGVHLKGDKAAWRWDRASERLVAQP